MKNKPFNFQSTLLGVATAAFAFTTSLADAATETFNTVGTTDWMCPAGVTTIQVECWGGGGAGGAGRKDSTGGIATNGGGGGGGAYATSFSVPVTPGLTYTITIPPAAISGSNGTAVTNSGAVNGGSVTFVGDGGVTTTALGGSGGLNRYIATGNPGASGAPGGAGGSSALSVGDAKFAGGSGSAGIGTATNVSGSGGGGAGNANPGGAAVTGTSTTTPGAGGLVGGGNGGQGSPVAGNATPSVAGSPGATPGGGGGGAKQVGTGTTLGGAGGIGQITITYSFTPPFAKENNSLDLNLATSWVGGMTVPGATDIAGWDSTVLAANTTVLGADTTWAGLKIANPGGLVTINPGNTLTLGAAPVDIDMRSATQDLTLNSDLVLGAINYWDVASSRTLTLGGAISGSASLIKAGAGTAILSGANTYTGSTNVNGGTLNITGSITGLPTSSKINVAPTSGNAIVNYSGGDSTLFAVTGATVPGSASVFNLTGGTVTISPGITTGTQSVVGAGNNPAPGAGAYGFYNITGGTFRDLNRFTLTSQAPASATNGTGAGVQTGVVYVGGTGTIDQTGGEWMLNYSLGQITVADSGKIDRTGSTNFFGLIMNHATGVTGGGYGVLNLAGANAQVILGAQPIRFGNNTGVGNGDGQSGFVNVAAGTLSLGANVSVSLPAAPVAPNNAYFNFAGGTVKATGNLTGWIPVSTPAINFNSNLFGQIDNNGTDPDFIGGLTVDSNSFTVTLGNPLQAAGGSGVTQANLNVASGGSGYVGPPAVIFSSTDVLAGGSPAAGYALINTIGEVTGIVITSPGTYTPGITPTVSLIGGGGSGASVTATPLNTLNTSGGLTKTGAGTLILSAANTYSGPTLVSVGTLKSSTAGSSASDITVAGGAAGGVLVAATDGQWVSTGDLTLNTNSTLVVDYGSIAPGTVAPIKVDNFIVGTNLGLKLETANFADLVNAQSYPLITWTNSGPTDVSAFAGIFPSRLVGNLSVTGNTLSLNVTSNLAGQAISWNTGNGTWNTVANNWVDANLATTAYRDGEDRVLFGDAAGATGNPIITLNSALSPSGVTMDSTSHDYTITGTGGIGGTGGLTLGAANTKTLTLATANTYTGSTIIDGGTLKLSGAGTLGAAGSPVAVGSGGLLDLNGTNQTINPAAGTGVGIIANNSGSGTSILSLSGTGTINGGLVTIQDNTTTPGGKVAVVVTGNTQPMSNDNTYTGGTTVNAGAFLYLNSTSPLGAGTGPINLPASGATTSVSSGLLVDGGTTYANDISGAGYVHNNSGTAATATLTGNVNTSGNFNVRVAGGAFDFAGSGDSTLSGVIGPAGGNGVFGPNTTVSTGNIIKSGTGTLTLSGANLYSGSTTVREGILNLTGNRTANAGAITVGNLVGSTGTLNVSGGTFTTGVFFVGSGDDAATAGIVNQTAGTLTMSGNQLLLGNGGTGTAAGSNSTGTYNLSGGTLNTNAGGLGVTIGTNIGATGVFNLSGTGNLNMAPTSTMQIGRSDGNVVSNTTGTFAQTGGTATVGILRMGGAGATTSPGTTATLALSGGTFSAVTFNALSVGNNSSSTINISGTADVTLPAFPTARGTDSTVTLNFDGGTLKPLAASPTYISNLTNAFIKAGGAKIDTTNGSITILQGLLTDGSNGGLTKEGTNTLTLAGPNTYTGNTTVSAGSLELAATGQLTFVLGATSGANNSLTGTDASLKGSFVIDTSAADSLSSGTWLLEDIATLTGPAGYDASFSVSGFTSAGTTKWTKAISGGKAYTFDETTGILTLGLGRYASWAAINAPTGTPEDDFDKDGVSNAVEYVLGGDKETNDLGKLPKTSTNGGNMVFTFERDQDSIDGTTTVVIEVGTTLLAWPDSYTVGSNTAGSTPPVTVDQNLPAAGTDTVTLSVPQAPDAKKFARLKVTVLP